jgi:hypothetical protein
VAETLHRNRLGAALFSKGNISIFGKFSDPENARNPSVIVCFKSGKSLSPVLKRISLYGPHLLGVLLMEGASEKASHQPGTSKGK